MAGLRMLQPALMQTLKCLPKQPLKNGHIFIQRTAIQPGGTSIVARSASGKMIPMASEYEYTRFKNEASFYFWIAALPLGLIIAYTNLFIGPAEISDIPDDYEPKYWEYYKRPLERLIAKYILTNNYEAQYKINITFIHEKSERTRGAILLKRVKMLQQERFDYKGWYYVPFGNPTERNFNYGEQIVDSFGARLIDEK